MSPAKPSSTCIQQALDVLSKAPRATLLRYKAKLQAVVQKLDDPTLVVSATPLRPRRPAKELVKLLEEDLPKIKTLLSQVCVIKIRHKPEWINEDPRIVDIQISGEPKTSMEVRLRRVLSQRSLAEEFQVWENSHPGNSKGAAEQGKKLGHLNIFLSVNANRFHNRTAARDGIQQGQKLFKCEKSLGLGFSAILIFYGRKIRGVGHEQLNDFKCAIEKQHENAINNNHDSIKEIAKRQEKWLNERQIEYNAWYAKYIEDRTAALEKAAAPTAGTKRLLPSLPLPQPKRNKPYKQQGDPLKTARSSRKGNLRKETSLGASATDPLTGPNSTNISSAVAPLPAQHTQSDVHEQYQQPPSPPLSSQNNVSLSVCDGFNRDNIDDINGRVTVPRSFNSSMQETQGSVLHREEPTREVVENGLSDSSNAMPSSFPMDPQRHQEQEHIY